MFQPESAVSVLPEPNFCRICGNIAHGKHYEAITCRACAAFFRRAKVSKVVKRCKKDGKCNFYTKGFFNCKYCRLQQCLKAGMTVEGFQYDRDTQKSMKAMELVPSVSNFLGRPNLIIFSKLDKSEDRFTSYIDVQFLIDNFVKVLNQGPSSPLHSTNRLKKLGVGFQEVQNTRKIMDPNVLEKIGKEETFSHWEDDVLQLIKWLTYFDDFRVIPETQQIQIIKVMWKMWNRLATLATIAGEIRKNCPEIEKIKKDSVIFDWNTAKLDMSWLSSRSIEELKFFIDDLRTEIRFDDLVEAMVKLNPTNEELSFMICQLCFQYVGKRYQGDILTMTETFQENISNDLHSYYLERNRPHYANRLTKMMKINNQIQKNVYQGRQKIELAILFDVFNVKCSHPEMFFDIS